MLKPLFSKSIPVYFIAVIIAFFAAMIVLNALLRRDQVSRFIKKRIRKSFFVGSICAVICANVANWFLFENAMDASLYLRITQGGYTFIFGALGFFIVSALLLRLYKVNVGYALNTVTPAVLLAQFIGRIGCSLKGCCFGQEINGFLLPVREAEAMVVFALFLILLFVGEDYKFRIYGLCYSIFRFVAEFFRGDDRGTLFGIEALSPTQVVTLVLIPLFAVMLLLRPVMSRLNKEEALDAFKNKLKQVFRRKGKEPYEPYPLDHTQKEKLVALKVIISILLIIVILTTTVVYVNPLNFQAFDNIRYKLDDVFGFVYKSKGSSTEISDTTGSSLLQVSGTVTDEAQALFMASQYDTWTGAEYGFDKKVELSNGNVLYVMDQVYEGKAVLGKKRMVVTDENGNALYIVGDAADYTFTNEIVERFEGKGFTVSEALGESAKVIQERECWYDTGSGIIEAKHQILSEDGTTALMGVVVKKSDGKIICYTGTEINSISSMTASEIVSDGQELLEVLEDGDESRIKELAKGKDGVKKALAKASQKLENKEALIEGIKSAQEIAKNVPEINAELYRELVKAETATVLEDAGESEKKTEKAESKIDKAFKQAGIKITEDEKAQQITVDDKKTTFKYNINFDNDVDTFNITKEENKRAEITIRTEGPVQVEVYGEERRAVVTMFVEAEESFTLYEEDGESFLIKVTDVKVNIEPQGAPEEYKIDVVATEETIPQMIERKLDRIEDAYNRSNLTTFMSMCAYEDARISLETAIAAGISAPMNDSCASCVGLQDGVDNAKTMLAMLLIHDVNDYSEMSYLKGTEMELEYFRHTETTDGAIIVKARIKIRMAEFYLYDGFTFIKLEEIEDETTYDDARKIIGQLFDFFQSDNYYITDAISDELFAAFGDTKDSISSESDLTSLYDLWEMEWEDLSGTYICVMSIDEEVAYADGHSPEKVKGFKMYTIRYNIMTLRSIRWGLELDLQVAQVFGYVGEAVYQLYNMVTNPLGALGDATLGAMEETQKIWSIAKIIIDPTEAATDAVMSDLFAYGKSEADLIMLKLTTIDATITQYYLMLNEL